MKSGWEELTLRQHFDVVSSGELQPAHPTVTHTAASKVFVLLTIVFITFLAISNVESSIALRSALPPQKRLVILNW